MAVEPAPAFLRGVDEFEHQASVRTLERLRLVGGGPKFAKAGPRLLSPGLGEKRISLLYWFMASDTSP